VAISESVVQSGENVASEGEVGCSAVSL